MKVFALTLSFAVGLVGTFVVFYGVAYSKQPVVLSDGKYHRTDGRYDLHLKFFDDFISVDVVGTGQPQDSEGSHFFAIIKGKVAVFSEGDNCIVYLKPANDAIDLEDHCGGTDGGTYQKSL